MPFIKVQNLTKVYTNPVSKDIKRAVDGVSFEIKAGDRLGIVGHNGAGKSTLLQILAGIAERTTGTVDIDGKVTAVLTLGVGLREDFSGRENIYLDGEVQGKSRAEIDQVIDEMIDFAELGEFIERPVKTYSTGMKSRLAFAMLVTIQPEILIIDEALSAGDVFFAAKANQKIREICDQGKIVILVSHSMQTINQICDRCFWMADGRIVMDDKPSKVTTAYVEAVRAKDEAALIRNYQHLVQGFSKQKGMQIQSFEMFVGDHPAPCNHARTGTSVALRIYLQIVPERQHPDLAIKLTRIDSFLLQEIRLSQSAHIANAPNHQPPQGQVGYQLVIAPLPLSKGIYIFSCECREDNEVIAMQSLIIEVEDPHPPTGGHPLLRYPCTTTVTAT